MAQNLPHQLQAYQRLPHDAFWEVEVLLPLALAGSFSYSMPLEQGPALLPGQQVLVPFGQKKHYTGVVLACKQSHDTQRRRELRPITQVLSSQPVLHPSQLAFYQWLASYYLCQPGEVLKAALPAKLRLQSSYLVEASPKLLSADLSQYPLADNVYLLLEALQSHNQLSLPAAKDLLGLAEPKPKLRQLEAEGWLRLAESLPDAHGRRVRCLQLAPPYTDRTLLEAATEDPALRLTDKQQQLLQLVAQATWADKLLPEGEATEQLGLSRAVAKALIDKGLLQVLLIPHSQLQERSYTARQPELDLPKSHQQTLEESLKHFASNATQPLVLQPALEADRLALYMAWVQWALEDEKQVVLLLPELTLTEQIVAKLQAAFSEAVVLYSSRQTAAERARTWQAVLQGQASVVVGTRAALLLPFAQLGLIIVDQEHDDGFKQHDPAPRYHARDAAVAYSQQLGIPIVLSSSTPALETAFLLEQGKYTALPLPASHATTPPTLQLVDMRTESLARSGYGQYSEPLLGYLRKAVASRQQAILFKNRRGYAPTLVCTTCGYIPRCRNCDISLTYHKRADQLRCHYCGYTDPQTQPCSNCGAATLRPQGIGTEQLEEHLRKLMPEAAIERMDADTTRGKHRLGNLLAALEAGEVDILLGTQMVTKGLHNTRVSLAAVLNADQILSRPDFRAHEQAYQLIRQFSQRIHKPLGQPAGLPPGRLLVQTHRAEHPLFALIQQPYEHFYTWELPQRRATGYPPFTRLIRLELRHKQAAFLNEQAAAMGAILRQAYGKRVVGPTYPYIGRLRGWYRQQALLKLPRSAEGQRLKQQLPELIEDYYRQAGTRALRITIDVDPR